MSSPLRLPPAGWPPNRDPKYSWSARKLQQEHCPQPGTIAILMNIGNSHGSCLRSHIPVLALTVATLMPQLAAAAVAAEFAAVAAAENASELQDPALPLLRARGQTVPAAVWAALPPGCRGSRGGCSAVGAWRPRPCTRWAPPRSPSWSRRSRGNRELESKRTIHRTDLSRDDDT